MKQFTSLLLPLLLVIGAIRAHGQANYDTQLKQLVDKRNAALSAVLAPIDARFKADAEQLLRRATQMNDTGAIKKIKATLGVDPGAGGPPPIESVKDLHKQLVGTTWKAVPESQVRPGLNVTVTFNDGTLEPGDLHYEINSHNSLTIIFKGGDRQPAILSPDGKHLKLPFRKAEFTYELSNH